MSRKSARTHAFKLIYQLEFSNGVNDLDQIFDLYSVRFKDLDEEELNIIRDEFYGLAENLSYVDEIIGDYSKWELSRLNKIDLALIRLAVYEMLYEKNKPAIVINEIVNLASLYGSDLSTSFINGILAKISCDIEKGVIYE